MSFESADDDESNEAVDNCIHGLPDGHANDDGISDSSQNKNAAPMPGSSKPAHAPVPSLIDGTAIKTSEMRNPIPIAMIKLPFMSARLRSWRLFYKCSGA